MSSPAALESSRDPRRASARGAQCLPRRRSTTSLRPEEGAIGPFITTSDAGDGVGPLLSDRPLVVGFDPVLRRRVWIHVVPRHTEPIDAVRRDLSRTGRLHWLTGRRAGIENWDAFEAPDGRPLVAALRDGTPQWTTLKSWLLDSVRGAGRSHRGPLDARAST